MATTDKRVFMILTKNKKAYFDFEVSDTYEAGLVLSGPEVKSVKQGQIDLKGSYVSVDGKSEAWLVNAYIAPYKPARTVQKKYNPHQNRKLLLTKKELRFLIGKQKERGMSLVPLEIYLKSRLVKIKVGVVRGKKKHDKREALKKKDFDKRKRKMI